MRHFVLVGALATHLVDAGVTCRGYPLLGPSPWLGGDHVVHDNALWRANWWVNVVPTTSNLGWTKMGDCEDEVEIPPCTAPEWQPIVYAEPTVVTWNGAHWANRWWASASVFPSADMTGNWYKLFDCRSSGGVDPTTAAPTTTTGAAVTTTTPSPIVTTTTGAPVTTTGTTAAWTTTTLATTTTPLATTTTNVVPTTTTTNRVTTTTANNDISDHWLTEPAGPHGECIWPAWTRRHYTTGEFVTQGNTVYTPAWWVDANTAPPAEPWRVAGTCTGEAPKTTWTLEELLAQIDPSGPEYQIIRDPESFITQIQDQAVKARETELRTASPAAEAVIEVTRMLPVDQIEAIVPGRSENPDNVRRVERVMSADDFEKLFPIRHRVYTYTGLLRAIGAFPAYCQTYTDGRNSDDICKRMLAVSFAHFTQEVGANWAGFTYGNSGHDAERRNPGADKFYSVGENIPLWKQALWWVREIGYTETTFANVYRQCSIESYNRVWGLNFQCGDRTDYFGRGSKQLSWNYNYGDFSLMFFHDANYLLQHPELVADTWLNFASAIWFAVTPQNPKPAMLQVIDGSFVPNSVDIASGMTNSFASTIDIINGALECRGGNTAAIDNRIAFYRAFMGHFGLTIDPSEKLDCRGLPGFTAGSAGAVLTYLDRGNNHACNLVTWQTPWKITVDGDYKRCVDYWFTSHWVSKSNRRVVSSYGEDPIY